MVESKRNKKDYISGLCDDLLYHILSFLPSTKEAVGTSILSRRWQFAWTHVPNIIFLKKDFFDDASYRSNIYILDKVLSLHSSLKVEKFYIQLPANMYEELLFSRLDSWFSSVMRRKVEDITVVCENKNGFYSCDYSLPQVFYHNSSLSKLKSHICEFRPNSRVSWESLKYLDLSFAELTDKSIENVLQGTPLLYSLKLYACFGFHRLDLSQNTHLKMLVMKDDGIFYNDTSSLQILGPYLEDFEILGWWWDGLNLQFTNISCNARVALSFLVRDHYVYENNRYQEIVKKLLHIVCHIKQLTLGNWCVQVLSRWTESVVPCLSTNRKCLILDISHFGIDWMCGIKHLLLSSHELDKLVINFGYHHNQFYGDAITQNCFLSSSREFFNCLEFHLKTVEISGFTCSNEYGYDFLKFLLANAKVLEQMVIRGLIDKTDMMVRVAKELLSFPRVSSSAVILLKD